MIKKFGCTNRTWIMAREVRLANYALKPKVSKSLLKKTYTDLQLLQNERLSVLLHLFIVSVFVAVCTVSGLFMPLELRNYFIVADAVLLLYFGWVLRHYVYIESHLQLWYMVVEVLEGKVEED